MIAKAGTHHFVSNLQSEFERYLQDRAFWEPGEPGESPFVKTLSRAAQAADYAALLDEVCAGARR
jgi:hypothetical protein